MQQAAPVHRPRHGRLAAPAAVRRTAVAAGESARPTLVYRLADRPIFPPPARSKAGVPPSVRRYATEDCSPAHDANVRQAAQDAIVALTRTIAAISATPPSPAASAALSLYFGANPAQVVAHYLRIILTHLPTATFECEYPSHVLYDHFCGQGATAYVRPYLAKAGIGNIHVCQPAFDAELPQMRMGTLVHEAAHRYAAAYLDKYYGNNCAPSTLTVGLNDLEKLRNADSYACLVETLG